MDPPYKSERDVRLAEKGHKCATGTTLDKPFLDAPRLGPVRKYIVSGGEMGEQAAEPRPGLIVA
jgi:hypothetical protein